ncbi:MAG: M67 family metallopeptidase [Clostridia bacterium]|nr:M67 family metallopeptidase [Clostridia bacterium]
MISMTKGQLEQFTEHAKRCLPEEACALLLGEYDENGKIVREVYITENVDHTNEHFTITPQEQLKAVRYARKQGWCILGNIHSHPETPSRPSEEDKRLAVDPKASYLIVSLMDAENPVCKAFHVENLVSEQETLFLTEEDT